MVTSLTPGKMCVQTLAVMLGLTGLVTVGQGYKPDEMECPLTVNPHIFSLDYWVPQDLPQRAWRTLPWKLFTIRPSGIPGAGLGVFSNTFLPRHTWLGEFEGEIITAAKADKEPEYDFEYAWRVTCDGQVTHYLDAMDEDLSNWMRFVNCPRNIVENNVIESTCFGRIYYRTTRDILPGEELLIYYGDDYVEHHLDMDVRKYHDWENANMKTHSTQPQAASHY